MNTAIDITLEMRKYLARWVEWRDAEWATFCQRIVVVDCAKNELLLQANQAKGKFWFIAQGLVRNHYTTIDGKEFNKSFISAPSFCGAMSELVLGQASRFSIAALEPTIAIAIPSDWLRREKQHSPEIQRLSLDIAEQMALKKESREAELLLDDASTRYKTFIENNEELLERIPAYHIASYLGITEVALSRIKRNLNLV